MSTLHRLLSGLLACTLLLAACTSTTQAPATTVPATRSVVSVSTPTPASAPRAPPTARVLQRADKPANSPPAILPADRDEVEGEDQKPNYAEAVRALPRVGSLAPDFTLATLDGGVVTLSKLRGRPVLINFWASWCTACRAEAPELQQLHTEYQEQGLVILGINVTPQDTLANAQAYIDEFKITFPIPMDEQGKVTQAYRVPGLPTSFFIDPKGIIRNVIMGQISHQTMLESLELTKPW